jgi:DnaJ-class molecular chaperone
MDLPISLKEAVLGGSVPVPTLWGDVDLKIPAFSSSGQRLKLKGKGLKNSRTGVDGDLIVRLQIVLPKPSSQEAESLKTSLKDYSADYAVRDHLSL